MVKSSETTGRLGKFTAVVTAVGIIVGLTITAVQMWPVALVAKIEGFGGSADAEATASGLMMYEANVSFTGTLKSQIVHVRVHFTNETPANISVKAKAVEPGNQQGRITIEKQGDSFVQFVVSPLFHGESLRLMFEANHPVAVDLEAWTPETHVKCHWSPGMA